MKRSQNKITSFFKPKVARTDTNWSPRTACTVETVTEKETSVQISVKVNINDSKQDALGGKPSSVTFDKQAWLSTLTPDQKDLLQLEIDSLDSSWLAVLHPELTKPYFLALKQFLQTQAAAGHKVFPPEQDIYSWSRLTPLESVRVVILGQDPYHNVNQAHGLAFSVNPPTPPPPSLKNMYKGILKCYPSFETPNSGSLIPWARQGVLLLNACLTVQAHQPNSHAGRGWETFTERVLEAAVAARPQGICFMIWGTPASKRVDKIGPDPKKHLLLRTVHPSPLSASRGFFESQHFRKANDWLQEKYGQRINWALVEGNNIFGDP